MSIGMCIGLAIGTAIGAATHNMGTWMTMGMLFGMLVGTASRVKRKVENKTYDKTTKRPVIKASICNGEQVAGFKDLSTGNFEEVMLIKNPSDLEAFKEMYSITEDIEKIY